MRRRKKFSSLAISALMVLSLVSIIALQAAPVSASPETTYYVKVGENDANDGLSWANAKGTIDNAVKTALPNDTIIVGDGTYAENLNVDKENLTIRSDNGAAVTVVQTPNPNDHVFEVTASGVSISGFTVENATGTGKAGIYLTGGNCVIENNTCRNNSRGIILINSSDNNTLENNTCENNSSHGIYLAGSDYNTFSNNTFDNNSTGIYLSASDYNTFSNNTYGNNTEGIYLSASVYNTLSNNTVENNSSRGISLYNSDNNTLSNNTCENNNIGIYLITSSNYNTLSNNTSENNNIGIYLSSSNNNTLDNNTCENNSNGIYLYTSNNNTLDNNTCENNSSSGIYLDSGDNYNTLSNNTCSNNSLFGIELSSSDNNTLSNNTCENNSRGISLSSSENNILSYNTVENNDENGIYITGSTSSAIVVFNNITNNPTSGSGVHIAAGVDSTRSLVYYNNIVGNSPYGIYNGGTGKLNARYNWWGDASGPGGVGPGAGDHVGENVDYILWLTEPFENITINWNIQGVSAPDENVEVENIAEVTVYLTGDGRVAITVMEEISGAPIPGGSAPSWNVRGHKHES